MWMRLDSLDATVIGQRLHDMLAGEGQNRLHLVRQAQRRLAQLDRERRKLVKMAYADAIPLDLLKTEQDRITHEQGQAERQLAQVQESAEEIEAAYEQAQAVMRRGTEIYAIAGPEVRRQLNRAFPLFARMV